MGFFLLDVKIQNEIYKWGFPQVALCEDSKNITGITDIVLLNLNFEKIRKILNYFIIKMHIIFLKITKIWNVGT